MPACANCGFQSNGASKFCPECGAQWSAAPSREVRKTVTVLFCDLTGSTALGETLDPERLRALLARYFERMRGIVERHGGSVEKFIGDAVMAVFGVPVLHEDDALRALRAAAEMRDALPELGLQGRIGVQTGQVVTGTEERLATGDAVNVAARLEAAAQPGEVLIGDPTYTLVKEVAEVEAIEPLQLKGKTNPVTAYRLVQVHDAPERSHATRFVGRTRELGLIRDAWARVVSEPRCELVTITGDAGVGKSRLVAEALASLDATVVRGRCLPYGEGITYWPVVEVIKQLEVRPTDAAAAAAIRSLLGESEAATSAEELAWAFRKTLEAAATRPLVVIFDDIHWGEETFCDLVEHVALLSSGVPILLICTARPELSERRPGWPVTIRLEPLDDEDADKLMAEGIPPALRTKIARASGGNPLFIGEMAAMAATASGDISVPPTLQALLAARLDQLEVAERGVLERGAVEGEVFHRGTVQALAPDETQVTPRLAALVRKELIRPNPSQLEGDDGFRFRHLLIRDAAYEALPKAVRADLHQRFAAWLEQHGADLVELDEILGYHLEQACRYRAELGLPVDDQLVATARRHLIAGGRRADLRADNVAAARLYERAVALLPEGEFDRPIETDLVDALFWAGRGEEALRRAESLADRSAAARDRVSELCGRIKAGTMRLYFEPEGATQDLSALLEEAVPIFEAAGDDQALFTAYTSLALVENMRARLDATLDAYERAFVHAQKAGLPHTLLGWRSHARFFGTTPASEVLAWLDENEPAGGRSPWLRGRRAEVLAMLGRFDEARAILSETLADVADRGGGVQLASITGELSDVEFLAGDLAAAAELGEEGCRLLEELGERSTLSTDAGKLARVLFALGRLDEADAWAGRAAELGASDDAFTQMLWRQVRAKIQASRGDHAEAERLVREAVAIGEQTDMLDAQGDMYVDLGEVMSRGGRPAEAVAALEQALACYERKGNLVSAGHVRARLAEMDARRP